MLVSNSINNKLFLEINQVFLHVALFLYTIRFFTLAGLIYKIRMYTLSYDGVNNQVGNYDIVFTPKTWILNILKFP